MSIKIVPINLLKFNEIGIHEKTSLIYQDKYGSMRKSVSKLKLKQALTLPIVLSTLLYPKLIPLCVILQGLLVRSLLGLRKERSSIVEKIYLLKNGCQLLIITIDNTMSLVNIKDIIEYQEITEDNFILKTVDKVFSINLGNEISEFYLFKKIVFERFNVETRYALRKYNRFTINKIPEFIKEQMKKIVISYNLPPYSKISINSIKAIYLKRHYTHLLYHNKNRIERMINKKKNDSFYDAKKKIGLNLYSHKKFEKKFGEDIYHFMARLNSSEEERKRCLQLLEDCPTNGRNIVSYKKKLKLI